MANEAGMNGPFDGITTAIEQNADVYAVLLHPSYDAGDAVGYTQELIEAMKAAFAHVKAHQIRWEYLGSPIRGKSLLLVASKKPIHPEAKSLKKTVFREAMPTCLRHAPKNFNLNSLEHKSGVSYGFEYSHLHALPEIELWANKRLVIEELGGDRILARRLTKEEIAALYGTEGIMDVNDLLGSIPHAVIDTLTDVLRDSMEE